MSAADFDRTSPLDRFLAGEAGDPASRSRAAGTTPDGTAGAAIPARGTTLRATDGYAAPAGDTTPRRTDDATAGRSARTGRGGVVVRHATAADDRTIRALRTRDPGARAPAPPFLIAEQGGVPVAAIGIRDRRIVAEPFVDAARAIERLQAVATEERSRLRRERWSPRRLRRPRG